MQGLNWDLIWDHGPFSFSTFWGSSKISCEITGLFDDFVARFSSLISELHSLRPPLRPPLKGTPAFAPDSAHYAPTFATKICLKIIKNPGSHNFFWDPQCWKTEGPGLIYKNQHSFQVKWFEISLIFKFYSSTWFLRQAWRFQWVQ